MSATVFAITSDQHAGSTVALCPPKISLDDGGEYVASKAQRWLWQNWQTFWRQVEKVRAREKAKLYEVFNGDLTEGQHHGSTQILSGNSAVQALVVTECMRAPLTLGPDAIFVIRGTEAHVGKSAEGEEKVADGLRRNKDPIVTDPDTGTSSWWHARMEVQGVRLDFAHHGRMGQRPWTKHNITNLLAFQIWTEYHLRDEPHPHLAVRSHFHQYADTANTFPTRLIQTPAWQLHTAFAHKVVPDSIGDIGGLIIVIRDGKLAVEPVLYRASGGTIWHP